jgi:hypothetical protein
VIQWRHQQRSIWEGLFAEEVAELWEPWMRVVDELLEDEELVDAVYDAQGKRHPKAAFAGGNKHPRK